LLGGGGPQWFGVKGPQFETMGAQDDTGGKGIPTEDDMDIGGGPTGPGPGVEDPELPAGLPTYPGPLWGPEGGPQGTS
jgi:hypothetical protein